MNDNQLTADDEAKISQAISHIKAEEHDLALPLLQDVLQEHDLGVLHLTLGNTFANLKNYEEAVRCFHRALAHTECSAAARRGIGQSYFELESYVDAEENFKIAVKLEPSPLHRWWLGMTQFSLNELDHAEQTIDILLAESPGYGPAYGVLGNIYAARGDNAGAEELWARADELKSKF